MEQLVGSPAPSGHANLEPTGTDLASFQADLSLKLVCDPNWPLDEKDYELFRGLTIPDIQLKPAPRSGAPVSSGQPPAAEGPRL